MMLVELLSSAAIEPTRGALCVVLSAADGAAELLASAAPPIGDVSSGLPEVALDASATQFGDDQDALPVGDASTTTAPPVAFPMLLAWACVSLIGLGLSALFSGMETGIYTLNRVRLAVRAGRREPAALRLRDELEHPDRLLSTLLVGNNIANYLGTFGVAAILDGLGITPTNAIVINALILIPMLFVFAETLPKDLFRTHTDSWTYNLSGLLLAIRRILTGIGLVPFVSWFGSIFTRLFDASTEREVGARQRVSQLIREGVGAGVLSAEQLTLADRALTLRDRTVADEMIPWRRVATVPISADRTAREAILRSRPYSRMPMVDRTGRVAGVLHALDAALHPECKTTELLRPIPVIEPTTPSLEALRVMRSERARLAIVRRPGDERPLGLVALKDLVEPLVGELRVW